MLDHDMRYGYWSCGAVVIDVTEVCDVLYVPLSQEWGGLVIRV